MHIQGFDDSNVESHQQNSPHFFHVKLSRQFKYLCAIEPPIKFRIGTRVPKIWYFRVLYFIKY